MSDSTTAAPAASLPPPAASPPPSPPPKGRAWRWAWRIVASLLLLLLLIIVLTIAAGWWLLRTSSGTAWLLPHVPMLQVTAPSGPLLGDFSAERIVVPFAAGPNADRVIVDGLRWRGLSLRISLGKGSVPFIHLASLEAKRIDAQLAPKPPDPNSPPPQPPATLKLPLEAQIDSLVIGEIHATPLGEQAIRNVRATQLHAGANDGQAHRIESLSITWNGLIANATMQIGSEAPFAIDAQLGVKPAPDGGAPSTITLPPVLKDFQADLKASGPLERLAVDARLKAAAPASRPAEAAPVVTAKAEVLPFAAWPLGALEARTQALDLSALAEGLPSTALNGRVTLASTGPHAPATLKVTVENTRPGLLDAGLAPLRSLNAEATGRIDQPTAFDLPSFELQLGTPEAPAGTLSGNGRWTTEAATLDARWADLRPRLLDARAPDMRLSGTAKAEARGLVQTGSAGTAGAAAPHLELRGKLDGELPWAGRTQAVALAIDAGGTLQRIELRDASAKAGASNAQLSGIAEQPQSGGGWHVSGKGSLNQFDPSLWWPGPAGSAWRQGPHQVNGTLDVDLQLPALAAAPAAGAGSQTAASAPPPDPLALLAATRGQAKLALTKTQLAGVPITGEAELRSIAGAAQVSTHFEIAGTALQARGQLDTRAGSRGAKDHWELDAPLVDLARLKPLFKLAPAAAQAFPDPSGTLKLQARVDGRWPAATTTQGTLKVDRLRSGALKLDDATLRWQLGTAADAALDVQASIAGFAQGQAGVTRAQVALQGSNAQHRLDAAVSSPFRPPEWIDALQPASASASTAVPSAEPASAPASASASASAKAKSSPAAAVSAPVTGTHLELHADGGFQFGPRFDPSSRRAMSWNGRLRQFEASGESDRPGTTKSPAWLSLADVPLDASYDPVSAKPTVHAGAARLKGPGFALRWTELAFEGGKTPAATINADLEPIQVAPLLAKMQPAFGWSGDLVIAGHARVRSAPSFQADIEIARQQGDLSIAEGGRPLPLGLSEARVSLNAHDGVWQIAQAFAASTLGRFGGSATVRTTPDKVSPPPDSPLQGKFGGQVADLGNWGVWIPAGWRLAGKIDADIALSGSVGAPQYAGRIDGSSLSVRNLLEGVEVNQGTLAVALQGQTARIEKFEARAGGGSVRIDGNADFGANPQAQLKLVAERMQLLGRIDRRIVVSGQADANLGAQAIRVGGDFHVDEGLIDITKSDAPSLGGDVDVIGDNDDSKDTAKKPSNNADAKPAPARDVSLDVKIDLGQALHVRGHGINADLRGQLAITAPEGKLAINGNVATADGKYAAYGQDLTIERGSVVFYGPVENPRLDIVAIRSDLDQRVGIMVSGTALNPRIRLFSDADMTDTERLSWLLLGRAPDSAGGADTALLQRAALDLLQGEGGDSGPSIPQRFGLDDLSLKQSDTSTTTGSNGSSGSAGTRDTIVSLGKQISKRWYVGYERGLNATAGSWQLIYRLAQRFTVRMQSGFDNSVDLIWTVHWQ